MASDECTVILLWIALVSVYAATCLTRLAPVQIAIAYKIKAKHI